MARRSSGRPAAVTRGTLAALSLAAGVLLLACWAGPAVAAPARYQGSLDGMVRYLQNDQNPDGGFGSEPGAGSNNDVSAWVALALAAASINPRDQTPADQHYIGGHSAYGYLAEHAGTLSSTTDFDRELLVVDATGTSPTDFGGVNLLATILERQLTQPGPNDGAFKHEAGSGEPEMNDTIFAILALSPIHEPPAEAAMQAAAEWVEREQDCDHGWPSTAYRTSGACPKDGGSLPGEPQSEVDMTGAAIEALNAAGRQGAAKEVEQHAFEYLKTAQDADGGFPEEPGSEPNVASTAWVVQAMWSAGINPETWLAHKGLLIEEPLGYMASLQQVDGHIRWEQSQEWNGVWMTAYVGTAMTGDTYPPPPPPYEPLPQAPTETPGGGQGGESSKSTGGVTAGGGGNGAPLFSRPQRGSKGHTPGGARLLRSKHAEHRAKPRLNPGPARKTPVPTAAPGGARLLRSKHTKRRTEHRRNPDPARKTPVPTATSASVHHAKKHNQASHKGTGGVTLSGTGTGGEAQSSGRVVKGILIGAPTGASVPGAPGLRGAEAGENQTSWFAIGIAAAALALALVGALVELRRPRVIL
jgi:prenyltransferase beta subunit